MSVIEVRDYALWAAHVHGNEPLKQKLLVLPAGAMMNLEVDGFRGVWKKMDDGADGRPTPGMKPIGPAKEAWRLLQDERGKLVQISE